MKFLILGHPRSGTGFSSHLFKHNGWDVGHEKMGENGTSDWQYVIEDDKCFYWTTGTRKDWKFDYVIHCVRDPWTAISSVLFTETYLHNKNKFVKESEEFRRKWLDLPGINPIDDVAQSILQWNKLIKDQNPDWTIRIEHPEDHLKIPYIDKVLEKKVNTRSHRSLSGDEWKEIQQSTLEELDKYCLFYGYPAVTERIFGL